MKGSMMKLITLAGLALAGNGFTDIYGDPRFERPKRINPAPMTEEDKKRIHEAYNRQFHKFKINGVEILAKSKKDAKIIYSKMKEQKL